VSPPKAGRCYSKRHRRGERRCHAERSATPRGERPFSEKPGCLSHGSWRRSPRSADARDSIRGHDPRRRDAVAEGLEILLSTGRIAVRAVESQRGPSLRPRSARGSRRRPGPGGERAPGRAGKSSSGGRRAPASSWSRLYQQRAWLPAWPTGGRGASTPAGRAQTGAGIRSNACSQETSATSVACEPGVGPVCLATLARMRGPSSST
jgi:hypothetical protein